MVNILQHPEVQPFLDQADHTLNRWSFGQEVKGEFHQCVLDASRSGVDAAVAAAQYGATKGVNALLTLSESVKTNAAAVRAQNMMGY